MRWSDGWRHASKAGSQVEDNRSSVTERHVDHEVFDYDLGSLASDWRGCVEAHFRHCLRAWWDSSAFAFASRLGGRVEVVVVIR